MGSSKLYKIFNHMPNLKVLIKDYRNYEFNDSDYEVLESKINLSGTPCTNALAVTGLENFYNRFRGLICNPVKVSKIIMPNFMGDFELEHFLREFSLVKIPESLKKGVNVSEEFWNGLNLGIRNILLADFNYANEILCYKYKWPSMPFDAAIPPYMSIKVFELIKSLIVQQNILGDDRFRDFIPHEPEGLVGLKVYFKESDIKRLSK